MNRKNNEKINPSVALTLLPFIPFAQKMNKIANPVDLVNPLMGTEYKTITL